MIKTQHLLLLCSTCLCEIRKFIERATCMLYMKFTRMKSKSQFRAQKQQEQGEDKRVRRYRTSVSNPHHGRVSRIPRGLAAVAQLFVLLSEMMWPPEAWRLAFEGAIMNDWFFLPLLSFLSHNSSHQLCVTVKVFLYFSTTGPVKHYCSIVIVLRFKS